MIEEPTKNKVGAPKKDRKGKAMFIPAELIDTVSLMIVANRQAKKAAK